MIRKGFTLIELMVVITILGILLVGVIVAINPIEQIKKSNDAKRLQELGEIKNALEVYFNDFGYYPPSSGGYDTIAGNSFGSAWSPYMQKIPKDPIGTNRYVYYTPNGQSYYLYASLERGGKDPSACNSSGSVCPNFSLGPQDLCGGICNYGVTSSNISP